MAKRKPVNIAFIEPLYRVGALSNYEIAAQYGKEHEGSDKWKPTVSESFVRQLAKNHGWEKNLSERVQKRVRENLVRSESAHMRTNRTAEEIISQAAEIGSNVVLRHRDEVAALIEHENKLLEELGGEPTKVHVSSYQGDVTETVLGLTVREKAETLRALAQVRAQRIALEREAHNLDEPETDEDKVIKKTRIVRRNTRDGEE